MSAQPATTAAEEPAVVPEIPESLVDEVVQHYGGDMRLAVRELLADAAHLRGELYTASCMLSRGIGRGWQPKYERP
jgi:hypothetical protein